MKITKKWFFSIVSVGVLTLSLGVPTAAMASGSDPAPTPPPEDGTVTLRKATPEDIPVTPPPGKTVVITDEDGTVTSVTAVTASCTISMSAAKPQIEVNPRRVVALTSITVGSGCTAPKDFVGKIEAPGPLGGWFQKSFTVGPNVYPGGYGSVLASYKCPGTGVQQLRAATFNTPSGVGSPTAVSSPGSYACG